jgi:hypothetical protein
MSLATGTDLAALGTLAARLTAGRAPCVGIGHPADPRAAHSHPRSRAVATASVRLRAPNLAIADER